MAFSSAIATFTGAQDSVAVTWATAFAAPPTLVTHGVLVSDGIGTVEVSIPSSTLTATGCTVETSARFTGAVQLIANGV
jgi:hypothetical protein